MQSLRITLRPNRTGSGLIASAEADSDILAGFLQAKAVLLNRAGNFGHVRNPPRDDEEVGVGELLFDFGEEASVER